MECAKWWQLICLSALLALPLALTGCNTAEGFGEDLQSTGEAIEEEAQ